jgi:hypothetical protein
VYAYAVRLPAPHPHPIWCSWIPIRVPLHTLTAPPATSLEAGCWVGFVTRKYQRVHSAVGVDAYMTAIEGR